MTETWTHDDGRTITLEGVQHVDEEANYNALFDRARLFIKMGGVVHLEGILPSPEATLGRKRNHARNISSFFELYDVFADVMNWKSQRDLLNKPLREFYPLYVRCVDVNVNDLLTGPRPVWHNFVFMPRVVKFVKDHIEEFREDVKKNPDKVKRGIGAKDTFRIRFILWLVLGITYKNLVHKRNELAIGQALTEKTPVMLIWGRNHLPGMRELLISYGFSRTGE